MAKQTDRVDEICRELHAATRRYRRLWFAWFRRKERLKRLKELESAYRVASPCVEHGVLSRQQRGRLLTLLQESIQAMRG